MCDKWIESNLVNNDLWLLMDEKLTKRSLTKVIWLKGRCILQRSSESQHAEDFLHQGNWRQLLELPEANSPHESS